MNNLPKRDLLERLTEFHIRTIKLCKKIKVTPIVSRIIPQIVAASGSAAANYAEASEAMSKKDFVKSLKTTRKELKEYRVWITGLKEGADFVDSEFDLLLQESKELTYIFTSILQKTDI